MIPYNTITLWSLYGDILLIMILLGKVIIFLLITIEIKIIGLRRIKCRIDCFPARITEWSCGQSRAFIGIVKAVVTVDIPVYIWFYIFFHVMDARI